MRLLHTSDWLLGRALEGAIAWTSSALSSRRSPDILDRERVDLLLVAGDVFDSGPRRISSLSVLSASIAARISSRPLRRPDDFRFDSSAARREWRK